MSGPDYSKYPENPFTRVTSLRKAEMIRRNLESEYNNGFLPEPQYRAEMKALLARIKELGD